MNLFSKSWLLHRNPAQSKQLTKSKGLHDSKDKLLEPSEGVCSKVGSSEEEREMDKFRR